VDWGDGTTSTYSAVGDVTHTYASASSPTINVSLSDEDGSFANVASVAVTVNAPTSTVSLDAGADVSLDEGQAFSRSISFSDGQDNGAPGWTYSIDWDNDGTADETGSTTTQSVALSRTFTDGAASQTVSVTVTDVAGESASDSFVVSIANVAPTAGVSGADTVAEGSAYTLSVGAVSDPGTDTRTAYAINWGDGSIDNFTPAQWAAAAGSFAHTYADGTTAPTIVVSATDEDGSFTLGTKSLTVSNVAPTLSISGNDATNEGALYTLAISATDPAGANDALSYSIDWGDGSALQVLSAAQLAAVSGNVTHVFADDQDGPVNATARSIAVTVADGDGGSDTEILSVSVNNVAPTISASGAATATAGALYTLSLANYVDPGTDTLLANGISVDWGDGTTSTYSAVGDVTHTYASASSPTINVSLSDEDGSFANVASVAVTVQPVGQVETVRIGEAPQRQSGAGGQWAAAWSDAVVDIVHKADYSSVAESWSAVSLHGVSPQTLAGGDIYQGDLGVSGQSVASSSVRQELDGTEALRFTLDREATEVSVNLSRFYLNDDGGLLVESGLLRLIDSAGNVVAEKGFRADNATGTQQVTLAAAAGFVAVDVLAGAYDGDTFVFGGYAKADGSFGSDAGADAFGNVLGSDFLLDWVEFQFPVIGVASDPNV
jgi:hypothetical protein